jgi:type VI secretion system secreted protein VgrG
MNFLTGTLHWIEWGQDVPWEKTAVPLSWSGEETLSREFSFSLVVAVTELPSTWSLWLGKNISLKLTGSFGHRYIHGIIAQITSVFPSNINFPWHQFEPLFSCEVHIKPTCHKLHWCASDRVFTKEDHLTALQIIKRCCDPYHIFLKTHVTRALSSYDFYPQYQETDLNFIQRLIEDSGFIYYFDHQEDRDELVISEPMMIHPLHILSWGCMAQSDDIRKQDIHNISWTYQVRSEKSIQYGYNHSDPMTLFQGDSLQSGLQKTVFSGHVVTPLLTPIEENLRISAQTSLQCMPYHEIYLNTGRADLFPGCMVILSLYEQEPSEKYVVSHIKHHLQKKNDLSYKNIVTLIPLKEGINMPPIALQPRVMGHLLGRISPLREDDPHGKPLINEEGDVRVTWFWNTNSEQKKPLTGWIRLGHMAAGQQGGYFLYPRGNQEVFLGFEEGHPARPFISHFVYNTIEKLWINPIERPYVSGFKMGFEDISQSEKSHHLEFWSAQGKEKILLNSDGDLECTVFGKETVFIKTGDMTTTLSRGHMKMDLQEGHIFTTVHKGNMETLLNAEGDTPVSYKVHMEHGDMSHEIKQQGTYHLKLGKGDIKCEISEEGIITLKAETLILEGSKKISLHGDVIDLRGKNISICADNIFEVTSQQVHLHADSDIKCDSTDIHLDATFLHMNTKSNINLEAAGIIDIKGTLVKLN